MEQPTAHGLETRWEKGHVETRCLVAIKFHWTTIVTLVRHGHVVQSGRFLRGAGGLRSQSVPAKPPGAHAFHPADSDHTQYCVTGPVQRAVCGVLVVCVHGQQ